MLILLLLAVVASKHVTLTAASFIFTPVQKPKHYNSQYQRLFAEDIVQNDGTAFSFAQNGVCIDPHTFIDVKIEETVKTFTMRNVPGDGDCMFLAVALATATSMGLGGNDALLRAIARETRDVVSQVLGAPDGNLCIDRIANKNRLISAPDLLSSSAKGEGLTPTEYLNRLKKCGTMGGLQAGGAELTVLSNVLRRPISIYEIDQQPMSDNNGTCYIKRVGVFGEMFQDPLMSVPNSAVLSESLLPGAYSWHIHILVIDTIGGEKHACALLPSDA